MIGIFFEDLDYVIAELGLDRLGDLARFQGKGDRLELRNGRIEIGRAKTDALA